MLDIGQRKIPEAFLVKQYKNINIMEVNLNVKEVIVRYFIMMAVVIGGVLTQQWWLAVLALPLFLTAITGMCPVKTMMQKERVVKRVKA